MSQGGLVLNFGQFDQAGKERQRAAHDVDPLHRFNELEAWPLLSRPERLPNRGDLSKDGLPLPPLLDRLAQLDSLICELPGHLIAVRGKESVAYRPDGLDVFE